MTNNPSSKSVDEILEKLVKNFAYIWDEKERLWWGHDTNLENRDSDFEVAKSDLYQLIKDRVIKKDEMWRSYVGDEIEHVRFMQRNELRASQRKALKELFGVKGDEAK